MTPEATKSRHPGRRVTDLGGDGGLTFPVAVSKSAIWMLASMLAGTGTMLLWLCLGQLDQGKILARIEERSISDIEHRKAVYKELERLNVTDQRLSSEVKEIQIQAAQHGWKADK